MKSDQEHQEDARLRENISEGVQEGLRQADFPWLVHQAKQAAKAKDERVERLEERVFGGDHTVDKRTGTNDPIQVQFDKVGEKLDWLRESVEALKETVEIHGKSGNALAGKVARLEAGQSGDESAVDHAGETIGNPTTWWAEIDKLRRERDGMRMERDACREDCRTVNRDAHNVQRELSNAMELPAGTLWVAVVDEAVKRLAEREADMKRLRKAMGPWASDYDWKQTMDAAMQFIDDFPR